MANCIHHQQQRDQAWATYKGIADTVDDYETYLASLEEFKEKISVLSSFIYGYAASLNLIGNYLVYVGIDGEAFDRGECFSYAKVLNSRVDSLNGYLESLGSEIGKVEGKRSALLTKRGEALTNYNTILYSTCPICSQNPNNPANNPGRDPNNGYRGGNNPYSNLPPGASVTVSTPYGVFSGSNNSPRGNTQNRIR